MIDDFKQRRFDTIEIKTIKDVLKHINKIVVDDGHLVIKLKLFEAIEEIEPMDFIALKQTKY